MPSNSRVGHQTIRFLIVGVATTFVHFIALSVFFRYFNYDIILSTALAFVIAVCFSYFMSHKYTFRSGQTHRSSIPKFILSVSLGFTWNVILMHHLVETLDLHYTLAFFLTTLIVMINNFLLTKFWVFRA